MKDRFGFEQGGSEGTEVREQGGSWVFFCAVYFFCWKIGEEWDGAVLMEER